MRRRTVRWVQWERSGVRLEPVDAHPLCVSGTVVLALLRLGVPLSEQSAAVGVEVERLRSTCAPGQRRQALGPDPLSPFELERLVALLSVEVADGEARDRAAACAWCVGVAVGVSGYVWGSGDAS